MRKEDRKEFTVISGILMTLLFIGMLTSLCHIQPVRAGGTIYIRADGSVDPPTANITNIDNVTYTFTDNIYDVIVVERSNIVVEGNGYTLRGSGSGYGFDLTGVTNVTLRNVSIESFSIGIYLSSSSDNVVSGNNITNNEGDGVSLLESSSNNVFFENNITGNEENGAYLDSSSHNNTFFGNDIRNNYFGVLVGSSDNKFYHNNFINNIQQVKILTPGCTDSWNDSYPSGGNYWSDYAGVDLYSGRYQNETGSDGIGDTPYTIDANNQDHYPLMNPYIHQHNIAVTNVTPSKTVVCQGYSIPINVTVENQGNVPETFDVTTYHNSNVINYTTVTNLPPSEETTITFMWNTTGVAKGNYTITAVADTVPGETDTTDNIRIDGWIMVAMIGDITGATADPLDFVPDGKVDMKDIATISRFFGLDVPPAPPNCDITGPTKGVPDGKIDMRDVATAARHFGETDP